MSTQDSSEAVNARSSHLFLSMHYPLKIKFITVLLALVFLLLGRVMAQGEDIKFGKPIMEQLTMTKYRPDTNANAVILSDIGSTNFVLSQTSGIEIYFHRHLRIKVFNKNGLSYGNRKLFLYSTSGNKENVTKLNGFTYNLEKNKVSKSKLKNSAVFEEQLTDNWRVVSFALPNVKTGSVIDIEYTIQSDFFFNLRTWNFQHSIPAKYSKFTMKIPEYFEYKTLFKGYHPVNLVEKSKVTGTMTVKVEEEDDKGLFGRSKMETHNINYLEDYYYWECYDVPPITEEPYVNNINNYITSIEFELASYKPPESLRKNFTDTWETIRVKLMDESYFGGIINKSNFLNEEVETIEATSYNDFDKMLNAYEFAKKKIKWNYKERLLADDNNIKKIYNEGVGNSADINLFLVALLRMLDLKADPVILSTRGNGILHPGQLMLSKFNYVIARVEIDGEQHLLDATEEKCPYYMLPERCINGKGRLINEEYTEWVDLNTEQPYSYFCMLNLSLGEDNQLHGMMQNSRENYAALNFRHQVNKETNEQQFIEKMEENFDGLEIDSFNLVNLDSINAPVKDSYEVTLKNKIDILGDMIYMNPLLYERIEENPFKVEERKYPVDYIYPRHRKYLLNFAIPENYVVEELPISTKFSLLDNSAEYSYHVSHQGNNIQLVTEFKINRSIFTGDEYKSLKEFYDKLVAKQSEQIVLKKNKKF